MTENARVALVTGATQGLGKALAAGLARRLGPGDVVYVTGRDAAAIETVVRELDGLDAEVRGELFDVGQADSATRMADEIRRRHGGVDIVFGNAVMRVGPDDDERAVVGPYVEVNNLGTTRLLRAFAPILRDGGRLVVVASSLGTLAYLAPVLHPWFDGLTTLDEVDRAIIAWRDEVATGRTRATAWPAFVNIPSKIGQVAAVRALAGERRPEDTRRDIMLLSVCPGMINTPTSGLWWDVSAAPTPAEAAGPLLDLVLGPFRPEFYGELVRAGEVLAWSR
jgi:NAD(P)-dependent dehydrogenase (short-subunit alcohol dehydrogenase family)